MNNAAKLRRRRREEAALPSFDFLSNDESLALTFALEGVTEKLNARPETRAKRRAQQLREADRNDPRLKYHWWERNYDDAFSRVSRIETRASAFNLAMNPGRPTLSTYAGGDTDVVEYREISKTDIESCFSRLWEKTQEDVARRRLKIVNESTRTLPSSGGADNEIKGAPDARLQARVMDRLWAPRQVPRWEARSTDFIPQWESSAILRSRAKSSLPALGPPKPRIAPPKEAKRLPSPVPLKKSVRRAVKAA
jgi:hypothetical protein